ncbi:MAG: class I SAM-dependent methyltransferase family protein [Thermoplasmatales archaeon]|nr:class I SAM-dependent methyltransferase family protein [Thermoplasmatales archaeon]
MVETPFNNIKKLLSKTIPSELFDKIPDKWEKVGDVGIIKLPSNLENYSEIIGKNYAEILQCKTILNDVGGITGTYREPKTKIIFGPNNTETIHKENGIRFKLDPQKIMFSSGNMDERIRMATISNENETVVDLFAGIGYFTLPLAVHSKPKKIFACEINPVAYDYLCGNIVLNNVTNIVEPLKGDNKEVAPKNVANRVILGYFNDTYKFLGTAFECLINHTGIIHYHDKFPDDVVPNKPLKNIEEIAKKYKCEVELLKYKHVKSYAPGISHYVFDIGIDEK